MSAAANETSSTADRELVFTRVFDAPRELVYEAWTNPHHMAQWWGPNGFRNTIQEMDVRPGGVVRFVMHGPDGTDWPNLITYVEVVPQERLVYDHGDEGKPNQFRVTAQFEAVERNKTRLTMTMLFPTAAMKQEVVETYGAVGGANQTLGRLEAYLPSLVDDGVELVMRHVFDAPRELVWRVFTERDHLLQWWGPRHWTVGHCTNDLRTGGVMHYQLTSPDGGIVLWGRWIYREIIPPERLQFVSSFSDETGGVTRNPWSAEWPLETLTTFTFAEKDGKTELTMRGVPINADEAARQDFKRGHASMNGGWGGTFEQLAEYLRKVGA